MDSKHLSKGAKPPAPLQKGKIRLYSNRFCPYAQRVVLILDAKKVRYEVININLLNKPEWLYEKSPMGKVPALEIENGEVIYESQVIADYLDEKYSQNHLHPKDPLQKAKDQLLLRQFTRIINAMLKTVYLNRIDDDEAQVIANGLETFEQELVKRSGEFFGGNTPGMLDYMIWPWCERADVLKMFGREYVIKKEKYKRLMQWRNAMKEDDAVKKSFFSTDIHMKYMQSYKAGVPDYDFLLNSD